MMLSTKSGMVNMHIDLGPALLTFQEVLFAIPCFLLALSSSFAQNRRFSDLFGSGLYILHQRKVRCLD